MSRNNDNNAWKRNLAPKTIDPIANQMIKDQHIEKHQLVDAAELYLCSSEAGERERELIIRNAIDAANAKRKIPKAKAVVELNPNWVPAKVGGRHMHKYRKQSVKQIKK